MTSINGVDLNATYSTNTNNKTVNTPTFKGNEQGDIFVSQKQAEKKGSGGKIIAGLGIAAAAIGAGIMIFKGKGKKALDAGKKIVEQKGDDVAKVVADKADDTAKVVTDKTDDVAKVVADKVDDAAKVVADKVDDAAKITTSKLSDIKFDKGTAKKGNELFTGTIDDTLKSGKKVKLEYKDGRIAKSTFSGEISTDYGKKSGNIVKEFGARDTEGKETIKKIFQNNDEKILLSETQKQFEANGKISSIFTNTYPNSTSVQQKSVEFFDGKLLSINEHSIGKKTYFNKEGKARLIEQIMPDGSTKQTKLGTMHA